MPTTMFPINLSALPFVATRKALLVLDLQNDFVSPDGALPVEKPDAFVSRTLDFAKAFRDSGAGDVIWVRTEFERHCPIAPDGDQVIVSDVPPRRPAARGRRSAARVQESTVLEGDNEAFLSVSAMAEKPLCVRKGTSGAELAPRVQEAVVTGRDTVFTKHHYSAFASEQQQLVQMLRGRFVTEMYICGALSNVSIYATALDAGKHGHEMTIVEDCCGYRNELRHMTALRQLTELTGCEVLKAEEILAKLPPPKKKQAMTPPVKDVRGEREKTGKEIKIDTAGAERDASIRPPASHTTGLSPAISKISLSLNSPSPGPGPLSGLPSEKPSSEASPAQPQGSTATTSTGAEAAEAAADARSEPKTRSQSDARPLHMDTPLEARDSDDTSSEEDSDEGESLRAIQKRLEAARAARLAATNRAVGQPHPAQRRPSSSSASATTPHTEAEHTKTRIKNKQQQQQQQQQLKTTIPEQAPTAKPQSSQLPQFPRKPSQPTEKISTSTSKKDQPSDPSKAKASTMAEPQDAPAPTFSEPMCEGDTTIITNVLPPRLAETAFDDLLQEVSWAGMSHLGGEVPRRIAVQGDVDDEGDMPVYRHPSDESPPLLPFSPTVLAIKTEIEKHLGHPLNHVLIQHYRSGNDYISEHSDKTLDIVRGSFIANVSLGAERTMLFRTKRQRKEKDDASPPKKSGKSEDSAASKGPQRQAQRAPLPHNSLCRMGLETNKRWLHAIKQDKRSEKEKTAAELSHGGARISLTFRQIGTFLDSAQSRIWGQGAVAKAKKDAHAVVNGQTPEAVRMLQAFGAENNSSDFDWDAMYGEGFNVLHMGTPKRFCTGGKDPLANTRVALALAELGISCAKGSVEGDVRFEDNDVGRAVVDGHETVLRYLDAVYGAGRRYDQLTGAEVAKRFVRLQKGLDLFAKWRAAQQDAKTNEDKKSHSLAAWAKKELAEWEKYAEEAVPQVSSTSTTDEKENTATEAAVYIAGGTQPSPADFALWPVLHDIVRECGEDVFVGEHLKKYYQAFRKRSSVEKALGLTTTSGQDKTRAMVG
ncbi:alpha-ketoglutarate-dependent dioxygenase alkB 2 [Podospora aff. communis PSN243]|uniref:Alpha-ketoglutarate-dependent dioxygenase alkB 2 n=1 Tax=Podospora aff. communis PSN243 TaxID=3040156 RepID=A0AAV9G5W1_9PEZI|nr:alpha-ketoglutarate-dependent dioxygenase alkB 2 [Podospora aff. communis PSN243]